MKRLPQVVLILSAALLLGAEKAKVRPQNADDGNAVAGAEGSAAGAKSREQKSRGDRQSEKTAGASAESIERWIRELGDDQFGVRENAERRLIRMGSEAVWALLKAYKSKDAEVQLRATRILRQIERHAAKELEKHGARVQWSDEGWVRFVSFRHHRDKAPVKDPGTQYLAALRHLEIVELCYTQTKDGDLIHLRGMTKLSFLRLDHTDVTDCGLVHLSRIKSLHTLDLGETRVTGKGLVALKHLPNLEQLAMSGAHVTDESLTSIQDLQQLRGLYIAGRKISDQGLTVLGRLRQLNSLGIDRANISDAGLAHLKDLENLTHLSLHSKCITDAGMRYIRGLKRLRQLILKGTCVTPSGLAELSVLADLRSLIVDGTPCTDQEVDKLRSRLSAVRIQWEP